MKRGTVFRTADGQEVICPLRLEPLFREEIREFIANGLEVRIEQDKTGQWTVSKAGRHPAFREGVFLQEAK